ncbi:MAG: hypothetical protein NC307_06275 [Roseburia sp.]|nr:hypothetical protein [Roseburia sp.]
MNTKPIPALLALFAGFVTCIMSFVQHVDIVVFAKRFVIVCVIFFIIGMIARILIEVNFKDYLYPAPEEEPVDEESIENIDSQEASEGESEGNREDSMEEELEDAEEELDEAEDE